MREKIKAATLGITIASFVYATLLIQTLRSIRHERRNQHQQS